MDGETSRKKAYTTQNKVKGVETQSSESEPVELHSLKKENEKLSDEVQDASEKINKLSIRLRSLHTQNQTYKKRLIDLKQTLKKMSTGPLLVGYVENIVQKGINEPQVVVKLINGQCFLSPLNPEVKVEIGDMVSLTQNTMVVVDVLPSNTDKYIAKMVLKTKPKEKYSDIGGLDQQIQEIREIVELPLTNPQIFESFKIFPPNGVLLHGPPGTGKTLLAKAVANATNAKLITLVASELVQKFIGEGARLVRELFAYARENAPAIIFIDEIDAIAAARSETGQSGEREVNRTLMQLLAEMDGFKTSNTTEKTDVKRDSSFFEVRIMATTNRVDILDKAILRPGRFDRIIELPLPDCDARLQILELHSKDTPTYGVHLEEIAEKTEGCSGADLKAICNEAAMFAIRDRLNGSQRTRVVHKNYEAAMKKVMSRGESKDFSTKGSYMYA